MTDNVQSHPLAQPRLQALVSLDLPADIRVISDDGEDTHGNPVTILGSESANATWHLIGPVPDDE